MQRRNVMKKQDALERKKARKVKAKIQIGEEECQDGSTDLELFNKEKGFCNIVLKTTVEMMSDKDKQFKAIIDSVNRWLDNSIAPTYFISRIGFEEAIDGWTCLFVLNKRVSKKLIVPIELEFCKIQIKNDRFSPKDCEDFNSDVDYTRNHVGMYIKSENISRTERFLRLPKEKQKKALTKMIGPLQLDRAERILEGAAFLNEEKPNFEGYEWPEYIEERRRFYKSQIKAMEEINQINQIKLKISTELLQSISYLKANGRKDHYEKCRSKCIELLEEKAIIYPSNVSSFWDWFELTHKKLEAFLLKKYNYFEGEGVEGTRLLKIRHCNLWKKEEYDMVWYIISARNEEGDWKKRDDMEHDEMSFQDLKHWFDGNLGVSRLRYTGLCILGPKAIGKTLFANLLVGKSKKYKERLHKINERIRIAGESFTEEEEKLLETLVNEKVKLEENIDEQLNHQFIICMSGQKSEKELKNKDKHARLIILDDVELGKMKKDGKYHFDHEEDLKSLLTGQRCSMKYCGGKVDVTAGKPAIVLTNNPALAEKLASDAMFQDDMIVTEFRLPIYPLHCEKAQAKIRGGNRGINKRFLSKDSPSNEREQHKPPLQCPPFPIDKADLYREESLEDYYKYISSHLQQLNIYCISLKVEGAMEVEENLAFYTEKIVGLNRFIRNIESEFVNFAVVELRQYFWENLEKALKILESPLCSYLRTNKLIKQRIVGNYNFDIVRVLELCFGDPSDNDQYCKHLAKMIHDKTRNIDGQEESVDLLFKPRNICVKFEIVNEKGYREGAIKNLPALKSRIHNEEGEHLYYVQDYIRDLLNRAAKNVKFSSFLKFMKGETISCLKKSCYQSKDDDVRLIVSALTLEPLENILYLQELAKNAKQRFLKESLDLEYLKKEMLPLGNNDLHVTKNMIFNFNTLGHGILVKYPILSYNINLYQDRRDFIDLINTFVKDVHAQEIIGLVNYLKTITLIDEFSLMNRHQVKEWINLVEADEKKGNVRFFKVHDEVSHLHLTKILKEFYDILTEDKTTSILEIEDYLLQVLVYKTYYYQDMALANRISYDKVDYPNKQIYLTFNVLYDRVVKYIDEVKIREKCEVQFFSYVYTKFGHRVHSSECKYELILLELFGWLKTEDLFYDLQSIERRHFMKALLRMNNVITEDEPLRGLLELAYQLELRYCDKKLSR